MGLKERFEALKRASGRSEPGQAAPSAAPPAAAAPAAPEPALPAPALSQLPAAPVPSQLPAPPALSQLLSQPPSGTMSLTQRRRLMEAQKQAAAARAAAAAAAAPSQLDAPLPASSQHQDYITLPNGRHIRKETQQPQQPQLSQLPASQLPASQPQPSQQQQQAAPFAGLLSDADRGAACRVVQLGAGQDAFDADFELPAPQRAAPPRSGRGAGAGGAAATVALPAAAQAAAPQPSQVTQDDMDIDSSIWGPLLPSRNAAQASKQRGKRGGALTKPGAKPHSPAKPAAAKPKAARARKAAAPQRKRAVSSGAPAGGSWRQPVHLHPRRCWPLGRPAPIDSAALTAHSPVPLPCR